MTKPKKKPPVSKPLKGLIILVWLGVMGYWTYNALNLPRPIYSEDGLLPAAEDYLDIYLNHEKIGGALYTLDRMDDGYLVEQRSMFRLDPGGGPADEIRVISTVIMNFDFSLRRFNFIMSTGPTIFIARGEVKDNIMSVSSHSGGGAMVTRTVPLTHRLVLPAALTSQIASQGLQVGRQYTARVFDPLTMSARSFTAAVVAEDRKTVPESRRPVQAFRLRLDYQGLPVYAWVDKNGRTIEEEGLMGLTLVRTTAEAWSKTMSRPDLMDMLSAVSAHVVLADTLAPEQKDKLKTAPRDLSYMRVGLSGVDTDGFDLDGRNQSLAGGFLVSRSLSLADLEQRPEAAYRQEEAGPYLRPEALIQAEAPEIRRLAASFKQASPRRLEQVKAMLAWLERNLNQRPAMGAFSALETLKAGYGDCDNYTVLAVALLRAMGIPARPAGGLLYYKGAFFYHAWAEAYWGDGLWVALDPLLGQFPADAGRIRLIADGSHQRAKLADLMGRLEITIYEAH